VTRVDEDRLPVIGLERRLLHNAREPAVPGGWHAVSAADGPAEVAQAAEPSSGRESPPARGSCAGLIRTVMFDMEVIVRR
jgi:hypothetical protein